MIYKMPAADAGFVHVVFELPSYIWADRVYVTGSFNDWDKTSVPVRQDRDGVWRAAIDLPVGQRYEFRYVVDGEWHTDYHADGFTDNIYGSHNSVLDLEHVPVADRTAAEQYRHPAGARHGGAGAAFGNRHQEAGRITSRGDASPLARVAAA